MVNSPDLILVACIFSLEEFVAQEEIEGSLIALVLPSVFASAWDASIKADEPIVLISLERWMHQDTCHSQIIFPFKVLEACQHCQSKKA